MSIKIGLAGNPNSGKTTMFNNLTGAKQYVGNWPGVTVEKKSGKIKGHKDVELVDLPGVYSLSPYTLEEVVTRNFMINDKPDVIINIIDTSNIERNLYLTTQVLELGIPTVIALNMMDIVDKRGDFIDIDKLSKIIGCPVVKTSALKGSGTKEVTLKAIELTNKNIVNNFKMNFSSEVNVAIEEIKTLIKVNNILPLGMNEQWMAIKLFERDNDLLEKVKLSDDIKNKLDSIITKCEVEFDDDAEGIITGERYEYIGELVSKVVKKKNNSKHTISDKIDKIVTNRLLALPIFALIMWGVYYIAVSSLGAVLTDWTNDTLFGEIIGANVANFLENIGTAPWLQGLINDGIIGGVGAVLGFVPQIMLLFFLLALLEDCGYMARIAFIMDRILRKFGLSGKSFIPVLISSGCGVPGIMATRTMENDKDRKLTIMLTTFIPCGAKLPIIALFAGAIFGGASWVAPVVYFLGIFMIIICGIILNQTKAFKGEAAPFVMELPQYHIPSMKGILIHMWDRGKAFIIKAGTIIFVACAVIWFTSSFSWTLEMVDAQDSILASIGKVIAPIFTPLGFGNWQSAVSTLTGFVAKENVVGTFGVLFGIAEAAEDTPVLLNQIGGMFTSASGFAFIAFNMLNAPCFAAIGAIRREMGSWKWMWITIGFQTLTAYIVALIINQVGSLLLGTGTILGSGISILIAIVIITLAIKSGNNKKDNNNLNKVTA